MLPTDELQRNLELSGLLGEDGPLGWSVGHGELQPLIPVIVRLEGHHLVWQDKDPERPDLDLQPVAPAGALDSFIRINSAEDVLTFAKRWGPLDLCEHNQPACHRGRGRIAVTACTPTRREPIERWLHFARQARAIVEAMIPLRAGQPQPREPWERFFNYKPGEGEPVRPDIEEFIRLTQKPPPIGPVWAWGNLRSVLDGWIRLGDVRPQADPRWRPDRGFPVRLGGYKTFGMLALQLLSAVTSDRGLYFCHHCQEPYTPPRKPQPGRRHYCGRPECKRAGARYRKRAQRSGDKK